MAGRFSRYMRRRRPWRRNYRRRRNYSFKRIRNIAFSIAEKKYWQFCFNPNEALLSAGLSSLGTNQMALNWFGNQVTLLGNMPQGPAEGQRIGNRIFVKYIQLQIFFEMLPDATGAGIDGDTSLYGMFCRYMVLLDKQPGGTPIPRINMDTSFGGGGANVPAATVSAFRDFNVLRRFKVLLDKQHQRCVTAAAWKNTIAGGGTDTAPKLVGTMSGTIVLQHYIPVNKQFTYTAVGSATDMKAAGAVMQDGDLIYQSCPSDSACCKNYVAVRVCYRDA